MSPPARLSNRHFDDLASEVEARRAAGAKRHQLTMRQREHLAVEGVVNVESFDDQEIVLETDQGGLVVRGEGLHIRELNVERGTLVVEGLVASLEYLGEQPGKRVRGLFGRLLR